MMIGFYATLFYKFGTGPHWDNWVGSNKNYCRENWWTNLLYVNNYVNVPNMVDQLFNLLLYIYLCVIYRTKYSNRMLNSN